MATHRQWNAKGKRVTTTYPHLDQSDSAEERRTGERRRVLLGGKLVFGPSELTIDCAIRSLSPNGARIRLPLHLATSDDVWLIDISGGIAHRAVVVWRCLPDIGLKFIERFDLRTPTPASMLHLRMLWLESTVR